MELWRSEFNKRLVILGIGVGLARVNPLAAEPQVAPAAVSQAAPAVSQAAPAVSQAAPAVSQAAPAASQAAPAVSQAAPAASHSPTASGEDPAATQFVSNCSGCHTIGAGASRGPDLAGVTAWPEPQLQQAVKSMERKVGPLSSAQIDAYVALLKDASARDRIAAAKARATQLTQGPVEPVDSLLGGALFFGKTPLANGGMSCHACHRFRGEGGDLAPDLTRFANGAEVDVIAATIARASFPVMKGAYELHPITQGEARHLAAYLIQARAPRVGAALADTKPIGLFAGIGAFGLALALIVTRSKGVRARLVQRATKR